MSKLDELNHEKLDALMNDGNTPGPVKEFITGLSTTATYLDTVNIEGDDESGYRVVPREDEPEAEAEPVEPPEAATEPQAGAGSESPNG